ncbi:MAG TPA: hypothetical protein VNJ04_07205 [Gemmatimonadaceae bacterium]|nr:hypothetical protein [Gemmatimonadaceae bacterium]
MIFTSDVTRTLTAIPGAEGLEVTIRMLNGKRLRKAADASQMAAVDKVKDIGGVAFLKEIQSFGRDGGDTKDVEKAARDASRAAIAADPLKGYDRNTLVHGGVIAWTAPKELNQENVEDLREETLDFLAQEILTLAAPKRTAADQKNG